MTAPTVVVRWRAGETLPEIVVEQGTPVRVLMVDENSPEDRVYEWGGRVAPGTVAALVGDSEIGQAGEGPNHVAALAIANAVEEQAGMALASRDLGFTGDACDVCGQFQMRRSGTCLTCHACGSTTGCS